MLNNETNERQIFEKSLNIEKPLETQTNKLSDFQENKLLKDVKEESQKSNFIFINVYVDMVTYLLILSVSYCSYLMYKDLDNHVSKVRAFNPKYNFPTVADMSSTLYMTIALYLIHKIFKFLAVEKLEKCLSKKYSKEEISIYKNKVATNIIKFLLYSSSTILGYYALKDLSFYPWSLGGKGQYKSVFSAGYPDYLFFEKTDLFDFYYNFNLAFALFDTYILLTYPLQSDFLLMVLHHLVTFNLIVFSYLTNLSNIGCIVYIVHYSGDILSMLVRICIHLDIPGAICCYLSIVFLVIFIYTRLFVFGDVLYHTYSFVLVKDFNIYTLYMCCFLGVLMMLNIIWITLISKKVINYLFTGKVEEIYKIKSSQETKKVM